MSSPKCKHRWHNVFSERGINPENPETQDLITVGLFCPKCLKQKQLKYPIYRMRTEVEVQNKDIYKEIKIKAAKTDDTVALALSPEQQKSLIIKNLNKLGYNDEDIENIILTLETDAKNFHVKLKPEHRVLASSILDGELMEI